MPGLLADLADEHGELDAVVSAIAEPAWDSPTPAATWTVRDQVGHLAFFDEVATQAVVDPERFASRARSAIEEADRGGDPMAEHLARGRAMAGADVLEWWRRARQSLLEAARELDPGRRVPWFGPPMSPLSFVSARLMETWAHGQDVADALGVTRVASTRLAHVAQLGVRARAFSYAVRGLDAPERPVTVELVAPGGGLWSWGERPVDEGATGEEQVVRGPALDFCLVVTQRRNLADTALEVEGDDARRWMSIAQAFAGPPGPGRPPSGT